MNKGLFREKLKIHYSHLLSVQLLPRRDKNKRAPVIDTKLVLTDSDNPQFATGIPKDLLWEPLVIDGSKAIKRVLVEGSTGIGKTKFCYQHALAVMEKDPHSWAIVVPLREIKNLNISCEDNEYIDALIFSKIYCSSPQMFKSISELMNSESSFIDDGNKFTRSKGSPSSQEARQTLEVIREIIHLSDEKIYWILDGADQASDEIIQYESTLHHWLKNICEIKNVLMTTCPRINNIDFDPDRFVEIRELSEDSTHEYIHEYFYCNAEESGKFTSFLNQQKDMLGNLYHIPIILEMLCWTWESFLSHNDEEHKLRNLANLYKYVWRGAISLFPKIKKKLSLELVENELEKVFDTKLLYQVAYELPRGSQSFSGRKVISLLKGKIAEDQIDEFISNLKDLAIIRITSNSELSEFKEYCFIHSTFQEYFAARHWVKGFLLEYNEKYKREFRDNRYDPSYKLMWVFVIGLLSENSAQINRLYTIYASPPLDVIGIRHMQGLVFFLRETLFSGNDKIAFSPLQKKIIEKVRKWFTFRSYSTLGIKEFFPILSRHTPLKIQIGIENNSSFIATFEEEKKLESILENLEHNSLAIRTEAIGSIMALWEKLVTNLQEQKKVIEKLLARLLQEVDDEVKGKLAEALGSLGKTISEEEQESALNYLITKFSDSNYFSRGRAAVAVGEILSAMSSLTVRSKWVNILMENLFSEKPMTHRVSAAQALGEMGSEIPEINRVQVITLLTERLDDQDDSYPRTAAAWALGRMKDILPEDLLVLVLEKLRFLLEHDNDITCKARAAFALNQLGDGISEGKRTALIQNLIQHLANPDRSNHYFKGRIIWALSEMKNLIDVEDKDKLVTLLLEYLCDDDAYVRDGVVEAFEHIPLSSVQQVGLIKKLHALLLKMTDEKVKQSIMKLLTVFDQRSPVILGDALPKILSEEVQFEGDQPLIKPKSSALIYNDLCDLLSELRDKILSNSQFSAKEIFSWLGEKNITWSDIVSTLVMTAPRTEDEKEKWDFLIDALLKARDEYDIYLYNHATSRALCELFPGKEYDNNAKWVTKKAAITKEKGGRATVVLPFYVIKIYDFAAEQINNQDNAAFWEISVKAPGSRTPLSDIDTTISVRRINEISPHNSIQSDAYRLKVKIIQHFHQQNRAECHNMGPGISRDSNVYSDGFMEQDSSGRYVHYTKFQNPKGDSLEEFQQFIGIPYKEFYHEAKKHKHLWEYAASLVSLCAYFGKSTEGINLWNKFKRTALEKIMVIATSEDLIGTASDDFKLVCEITEYLYRYQQIMLHEHDSDENIYLNHMHDVYIDHLNEVSTLQDKIFKQSEQLNKIVEKAKKSESNFKKKEENLNKFHKLGDERLGFESEIISATEERDSAKIALEDMVREVKKMLHNISDLQIKKQSTIIHANLFAHEAYINRSAPQHVVVGLQSGGDQRAAIQLLVCSSLQQIGFSLFHSKVQKNSGMSAGEIAFRNAKYSKRLMGILLGVDQGVMTDKEVEILSRDKRKSLFPALKTNDSAVITANSLSQELYELLNVEMKIALIKENKRLRDHEKPAEAFKLLKQFRQKIKVENTSAHEEQLFVELAADIVAFGYDIKMFRKRAIWGNRHDGLIIGKTGFFTLPTQKNLKEVSNEEKLKKFIGAWDYTSEDEILKVALSISRQEFMQSKGLAFKSHVMQYGFELVDVFGDGNCFFYALLDQLQTKLPLVLEKLSNLFGKEIDHLDLRSFAVDRLVRMAEQGVLAPIMPEINEYIANIARDRAWADGVIIDIIAAALDICIVLINSDNNPPTFINRDSTRVVYLGYQVGVHFQSLRGEPNQLIAQGLNLQQNDVSHSKVSLLAVPTLFRVPELRDTLLGKRAADVLDISLSASGQQRKK